MFLEEVNEIIAALEGAVSLVLLRLLSVLMSQKFLQQVIIAGRLVGFNLITSVPGCSR